jgi:diguanylate cyclase (GGDEF)-like protein/PAS domain S-box-containing protein
MTSPSRARKPAPSKAKTKSENTAGEALLEFVLNSYDALDRKGHKAQHAQSRISAPEDLHKGLDDLVEAIQCGVLLVNTQGKVHHCNRAALAVLGLAPDQLTASFDIRDVIPKLESLKVTAKDNKSVVEIELPSGKLAELHAKRVTSGLILTIKETAQSSGARAFMMDEEYRSLFENATCGIYRDRVDGTPVRCNPALAKFNGYDSEAEYRESVSHSQVSWYIDPNRTSQFHAIMKAEGCVKDFVSEVYRHRTREKVWITENAWYVRDENGVPVYIEGTIQDASERIATMEIIEQQANLDSLTGLASRHKFLQTLEANVKAAKSGFTVYTIDLDRFKPINDIYGHAAGDFVLKAIAKELKDLVPEGDLVARLGGDEFAILHSYNRQQGHESTLAENIVALLRKPLSMQGFNLLVGASVGLASFPAHGHDTATLLGNADLALYKAKKSGGNTFCIFDAELRSRMQSRVSVENDLKSAVAENQLELHYQPVVIAATGAIQGYEALMRWHHPTRGLLPPSEFIQIAEDAGLMTELGNWAIACASQQAAALPGDIKVAVNVSANQFRSSSILEVLRKSLDETKLDPKRLVLEITESVILSNEMIADTIYRELRGMGVLMALDDFGTGYSSLSYLQRFKFDKVKIDRSFVSGMAESPANLAIVRAIIGIGSDLGINIVAEGVETEAQAKTLIEEGCPLLQGYFYGKPKPYADAVNDLALQRLGHQAKPSELPLPQSAKQR